MWLGVGLFYAWFALTGRVDVGERPAVDVLGFRKDGRGLPGVSEVVAANRAGLMHASLTLPPAEPLLPDLVAHPPSGVELVGSRSAGTLRLKFTTRFSNQGNGPLEVRPEGDGELLQVVYSADPEAPLEMRPEVGRYLYEQQHGHLHIDTFARYELWSVDAEGGLVEAVVSNPKVGFCLLDAETLDPETTPVETRVYWGCRSEVQGLSVGWGDLYTTQIAAQALNVSGLPTGRYALVNVINYQEKLLETRYDNNRTNLWGLKDIVRLE